MPLNRRPLVILTISYIVGIIAEYYISFPIFILVVIFLLSFIVLLIFIFTCSKNAYAILIFCFFILGTLNMNLNYTYNGKLQIFNNKEIKVIGNVVFLNQNTLDKYILYTEKIIYKNKFYKINEKVILKIFNHKKVNLNNKKVLIKGRFQAFKGPRNPKMFDYRLYLKSQKVYKIMYVKDFDIKIIGKADLSSLKTIRQNIKYILYKKVLKILGGNEGKVALSLIFGDKKIIDESLYDTFKNAGIAHILAISGLHFGILYLFIEQILKIFKIKNNIRVVVILIFIWFFAFLIGFKPSVFRAVSLLTLYLISNNIDRRYDLYASLSFICFTALLINPLILFNVGFQLSFVAVLSLGMFYNKIYSKLKYLPDFFAKLLASSIAVEIGIWPIIAYHFNIFSLWAVFFNILVIFIIGYILPITLLFFVSTFINQTVAYFIGYIDEVLIKNLINISKLSSYVPFSKIDVISPNMYFIVFYYLSLIILFNMKEIAAKYKINKKSIVFIILCFLVLMINFKIKNELTMVFFDVGQGDCILIKTPMGKKILIDGGKSRDNNFLPHLLLKSQINKIDMIILTHVHSDHIGGVIDVLKMLNVKQIIIGSDDFLTDEFLELKRIIDKKKVKLIKVNMGEVITFEKDLKIKIIHPPLNIMKNTRDDINNNSLVNLLQYKDIKVLFTGDIHYEAERYIISHMDSVDIDILKVAHHGSDTSTSEQFLDFFTPEIAVIQVGKNVFGHPSEKVLKLLKENKVKVYRNDMCGTVIIKTDGKSMKVYEFCK
ncbi:DNA internalization-related competence protein ComEC/Rec2 [Caminicella sporogenes]|uniref:DNA internalization-related competence protein ComEC/Rec2 n=1 Tax=Caminicella sporogenes TaxID=166485 RepID=UPI0025416D29|nr:DNA internalization-related competence protein ComEC/Rec2 [Caminicella sporogenes]WIF94823.1 DNA internalization-related competence protein ComEC/Rec2 [Caminicella sporogenes]